MFPWGSKGKGKEPEGGEAEEVARVVDAATKVLLAIMPTIAPNIYTLAGMRVLSTQIAEFLEMGKAGLDSMTTAQGVERLRDLARYELAKAKEEIKGS